MDIPTQDISRNLGYGDLIFRKIKISEIEKAPTLVIVKELMHILFPESFFKVSALEP